MKNKLQKKKWIAFSRLLKTRSQIQDKSIFLADYYMNTQDIYIYIIVDCDIKNCSQILYVLNSMEHQM